MPVGTMLWWLIVGHALCDFPLQGDFLSRGKDQRNPIAGVPWYLCLAAHAIIHGGAVALIMGEPILGAGEVVFHGFIDYGKNEGWYGFGVDQALHLLCKGLWVGLVVLGR